MPEQIMMGFEIDKKIIDETTRCLKDFNCLKDGTHIRCKVEHCIEDTIHFVKCLAEYNCNYQSSFGNSFRCNCPVRKELYRKYRI